MRSLTPPRLRPPFGRYSHGIEVHPGARIIVTSGQLGIRPDDSIPDSVTDQAVLCFEAISAILAEGSMDFDDVIRINAFLTDRADFPAYMAVRDRYTGAIPPASTLLIVSGFTRPEFKVEVEVIAAREP